MTFSNITDIVIPEGNVTMIKDQANNIIWQKSSSGEIPEWYGASAGTDWTQRFMEIVPLDNGTVDFSYIDYSTDGVNWTSVRSPRTVTMTKYVPVFVKSSVTYYTMTNYTFDFYVRGNLANSFLARNTFYVFFENNTRLIGAKYFIVDCNQSWGDNIFMQFFINCTNLRTGPQLTATTLQVNYCYDQMFKGCTGLVNPPVISATTLSPYCYSEMFEGCTSLTSIPNLPVTNLADGCYQNMFKGCTGLTSVTTLPATAMSYRAYQYMFEDCTGLTKAVLPATSLANACYNFIFSNCSNLSYIKMLSPTVPYSLSQWVNNVSPTGLFVKNINATWDISGANGVPSGWDVIYYDPSTDRYWTDQQKSQECDENGVPV